MKLQESVEYFILNQQLKGCTKNTITGYQFYIDYFVKHLESKGINDTESLSIVRINEFHLHLRNKQPQIKQMSINTYLRHIRAYLNFLKREEIISNDIGGKMILPKTEKPVIEILTNEEIHAILNCNSAKSELGRRNRAIIHIMLDCGLRAEEVANLKHENINFSVGYVKVFGKGQKERIVPIGIKTRKAIMDYLYRRRMASDENVTLFLTNDLQKMTSKSISRLFLKLKKRSGVVRVYAHLLRHTFATNFLLCGMGDIYQLSQLLGHSDVKTTEKYLHIANYYQIIQKQNKKSVSYLDSFYH